MDIFFLFLSLHRLIYNYMFYGSNIIMLSTVVNKDKIYRPFVMI